MIRSHTANALKTHWFVWAAAIVLAGDAALLVTEDWSAPALAEAALLIDFAVVVPALYAWCYRRRGIATLWRAIALACLGVWAAGVVVPDPHRDLVDRVAVLRYLGLVVLVAIEIKLLAVVYRTVFAREPDCERVRRTLDDVDMPAWAAKLLVWEANLWRSAWLRLRRLFVRERRGD